MTGKKLDWQNPSGMQTFSMFKEVIEVEQNILESCKGIETAIYTPRNKGVFTSNQSGLSLLMKKWLCRLLLLIMARFGLII